MRSVSLPICKEIYHISTSHDLGLRFLFYLLKLKSLVAGQQSHVRLKPEYRLKRMFMELNVLLWKWNALKVEQCTPLNLRVGDY